MIRKKNNADLDELAEKVHFNLLKSNSSITVTFKALAI